MLKINESTTNMKMINYRNTLKNRQFVLNLNSEIHNYNTRNKNYIHILRTNHQFAKKCLRKNVPYTVNSIPPNVRDKIKTHSMQRFVNDIKTLYLGNYKIQCSIANCYICNKD